MGKQSTPKNAVTPPKGRPTRARNDALGGRRVLGPITQWVAVVVAIIVVIVVAILLLNGGDFNDNNDVQGVSQVAASVEPSSVVRPAT